MKYELDSILYFMKDFFNDRFFLSCWKLWNDITAVSGVRAANLILLPHS